MIEVLNFISFTIFVVIFFVTGFFLTKEKHNNRNLKVQLINLIQEKQLLEKALLDNQPASAAHTEGFIKFLTESRESAFQYIENAQHAIDKFINDIEPEITYFKEYGDSMAMLPNYYSMKKITESYEQLKTLLPEKDL